MQLNTILRNIIIWGIYLLPFTPLVVSTSMFFPYITGKAYFFRVIVEILFGVWIVLMARDASYRPKFSWILGAFALFLGVITLADLFGGNLERSFWSSYERMEGLVTHLHLFAYFLIAISVLNAEKLWERFFHISLGVSLFVILYGAIQLTGEIVINQGGVRIDGPLGNATYLAVYALFHFFFALFWFVRKSKSAPFDARPVILSGLVGFAIFFIWSLIRVGNPTIEIGPYEQSILLFSFFALLALGYAFAKFKNSLWVGRALYGLLAFFELAVLYYAATRGAIVGISAGIILIAFLTLFMERQWTVARKVSLAFIVGIVVFVGAFAAVRDADFIQKSQTLSRFAHISFEDAESRFLIWKMSIQGFKERPILGWGQESFNLVFNKYYDPRMYKQEPWFDRAHNVFFDWLIAGGILGLLAYLSLFAAALYYLWFFRKDNHPFSIREKSIVTGLLAAYFFQNIFVFDQLVSYLLFFSVLAFIHTHVAEKELWEFVFPKREIKARQSSSEQGKIIGYAVASLVAIGMPFFMYALNMNNYLQNRTLLQAIAPQKDGIEKNYEYFQKALSYGTFGNTETREQLSQYTIGISGAASVSNEVKENFLNLAVSEMNKQIQDIPNDARYRLFLSSVYLYYGFFDQAIKELGGALLVSPKKQTIYYALANAHIKKGEFEKAYEATRTAFELDTENTEARRYYGATAIYAGHDDVFQNLYGSETAGFYDEIPPEPIFINAFVQRGQFDKVVKIWEKKIVENPNDAQSRLSLAAGYVELGEIEKAIEQIKKVVELSPDFKEKGEQLIRELEGRGS